MKSARLSLSIILLVLVKIKRNRENNNIFQSNFFFQTGVCIWTFLTAINFKLIPGRYRTVFVGFCGFFWFTFLAYLKSTDNKWESPVLKLVNRLSDRSVAP